MISGVLLDLAGVVYEGQRALPGAVTAIESLHSAEFRLRFITNTTQSPKQAILRRLGAFGITVTDDELFTPSQAAIDWLKANDCRPHLLVHPDLESEFAIDFRGSRQAVVVGDAGDQFNYQSLNSAFRQLIEGAAFLALAKNRTYEDASGQLSLDAGAFVTALEFASQREAIVLGKPASEFFHGALASMNCPPEAAVMVGDDAETDVAGALRAGIGAALLVRTGKYRDGDERRFDPAPTATVDDLPAAVDWILTHL